MHPIGDKVWDLCIEVPPHQTHKPGFFCEWGLFMVEQKSYARFNMLVHVLAMSIYAVGQCDC